MDSIDLEDTENTMELLYSKKKVRKGMIWMNIPQNIPKIKLDKKLLEHIKFRESLMISSNSENPPIPVGGICLDIQGASNNKLLVHLSSQFDHNGKCAGSRITSWCDKKFNTIEERRTEFLDDIEEKSLYTAQKSYYYHVKNNGDIRLYNTNLRIINEGSNFILMRYFAITKFIGHIEFFTIYIDGTLCRNIYVSEGPYSDIINGKKLDLYAIKRIIIEECGIEHIAHTILTIQGQLVEQKWNDCIYYFHINPLAVLENIKPKGNIKIPLDKVWDKDLQMTSMFLDQKEVNEMEMEAYLNDHPEIRDMMFDFLQYLLNMKPNNVLDFAADFFRSFIQTP